MSTKHWMALSATGWVGCWVMFCLYLVASERADHKEYIAEHHREMSEIYAQIAIQAARAATPAAVTHTTVLPPEVINGY